MKKEDPELAQSFQTLLFRSVHNRALLGHQL
jgi:hypothetical protein